MARFLTFALVAPLASFGDIAVGDFRDGALRPARSALLGLIAGCLGLTREEEAQHQTLSDHYGIALLCYNNGDLLTDYHTTQAPTKQDWTYVTRAEELAFAPAKLETVLSRREYRTGVWHIAALWMRDGEGPWSLEALQKALNNPVFTPYWGRKSCPLSLPLAPEITEAETAVQALVERQGTGKEAKFFHGYKKAVAVAAKKTEEARKKNPEKDIPAFSPELGPGNRLFCHQLSGQKSSSDIMIIMDVQDVEAQGGHYTLLRRERRRDQPLSRTRWEFGLREEAILRPPKDERLSGEASS